MRVIVLLTAASLVRASRLVPLSEQEDPVLLISHSLRVYWSFAFHVGRCGNVGKRVRKNKNARLGGMVAVRSRFHSADGLATCLGLPPGLLDKSSN